MIILQNLIKAYHRKNGKSKYDRQTDRTKCRDHTDPVPCERSLKMSFGTCSCIMPRAKTLLSVLKDKVRNPELTSFSLDKKAS